MDDRAIDDDDDDVERARRKRRATARAARLGFFGALRKAVERRALMMESDSSDDYDSDEDDARTRARAERTRSAWASAVGESEADELERMMSDLSGAREMAMRMQSGAGRGGDAEDGRDDGGARARGEARGRGDAGDAGDEERRRGRRFGGDGDRQESRVRGRRDGGGDVFVGGRGGEGTRTVSAGSIFVDVRMIQCLSGLFIRVNVESGSGLLAMDAGETSDPYVKVSLVNGAGLAIDGQVHRTGVPPENYAIRCGTSRFTWAAKN